MDLIQAPDNRFAEDSAPALFLAGGITDCPDWQRIMISYLKDADITVYNPRQDDFDINNPAAAYNQIKWEYDRLKDSDMILFWFSNGSLNPIVLYELGMWGNSREIPVFIGCDKEYKRKFDVKVQTELARPEIMVHDTFEDLAASVEDWIVNQLAID